ncbi:MAG: CarD family transcriptional regulator [Methylobacteriaceae bacterium]|nr:CarD family transcriptional regulator [Methylobacteriaceae bacterium]
MKTGAVKSAAKGKTIDKAPKSKAANEKAKSNKNPVRTVATKETSQRTSTQSQIKKATSDTKTITAKTPPKPAKQAGARDEAHAARPRTAEPVKAETPAPVLVAAAPESKPASSTPAASLRETSEQTTVTQKKTIVPAAAKPTRPVAKPPSAEAPKPAAPAAKPAKPASAKLGFKTHEHIVYPAHGVGQIVAIEEQEVAGFKLELFVISFVKDKMILKVPTPKVVSVGMRKLAEAPVIAKSLETLTGRARIKRTMWSRRAQEYEAKINSGDLIAIAEVVRDLYRSEAQPEQSYSERQLYEAALDRMCRELAVVQKLTEQESLKVIEGQLQKGPRRAAKADADAEADSNDIDEAA